jgi:hypothetical protein
MAGSWTGSNLEEVFLSHEFDRTGAPPGPLELSGGRSAATPTRGQRHQLHQHHRSHEDPEESRSDMTNKPLASVLAFAPRTPAGRQRAIAAVGGLAAAVLVVVGVTSGGQAPGSGHGAEALSRAGQHGNPLLPPADGPPSGVGVKTGIPGLLAADHGRSATGATSSARNAATQVHGSFSVFNGAATDGASSSGASGLPSGGTSVAPSLPSTPATSAANPVTQLTGNVGTEVSTTTQQISAVVPAATPITGVVNNVAGTVSGLTGTLAAPNA